MKTTWPREGPDEIHIVRDFPTNTPGDSSSIHYVPARVRNALFAYFLYHGEVILCACSEIVYSIYIVACIKN